MRPGKAWQGTAWQAWRGEARRGKARLGMAWQARQGPAGFGSAGLGKAWQARLGVAWPGSARQGRQSEASGGVYQTVHAPTRMRKGGEMAVEDVREENRREWRAWADRNPDKALEAALARQQRMQDATAGGARNGEPWTEADFQKLMDFSRPMLDIARDLGRTYKACVQARRRRLKLLGLGTVYLKSETDPYDGSDRKPRIEATRKGGFFDERTT